MSNLSWHEFAKVGSPVSCIQGNAKLSGIVRANQGKGNLLIEWRDGIFVTYTKTQMMSMGITEGCHTNTPVLAIPRVTR